MVFELLKLNIDVTDDDFNDIYPERIRRIAKKHWTPVSVAKLASEFLAEKPGTKVLDIGSGCGKFCMVGAVNTRGHFTGIEQRPDLVELSNRLSTNYSIPNVKFLHANILSIPFGDYDAFYFFNSFQENIDEINKIDNEVRLELQLYHRYSMYLVGQFALLPVGTRIVTYHSSSTIIPRSFKLQDTSLNGLLSFWEKVKKGRW